ncbi:DNA-directed primase/polymerase protein [Gadus morhua]|uniref:DNA-directed primase/polymerase protein n=1 Tax=Gadus morhua TaxID=8049 RepID=A0A8C5F6L8_GADMO|nr:DNA-directed primase/polymerase protein [Gadus morhua]
MRKWEERVKKVEGLAQAFHKTPLTTPYKPRLWPCQPSSVWKLFPRQNLAMSFTHTCKEDVHIFALEKEKAATGQRIYLVTSYSELWHYYRTFQHSLMHCYEVIPEGAVCKLYFDLEFHRLCNQGLDGKAMVCFLVQYVCERLMEVYGVACSAHDVLNLDSSTEDKFSRHLIFCLSSAAFKDNIHMGKFVHGILTPKTNTLANPDSDAENDVPGWPGPSEESSVEDGPTPHGPMAKRRRSGQTPDPRDLSCLKVKGKQGQEGLFVDLGVYTKNRNFRLYKSSKVGKNVALTVAEDNLFSPRPVKNLSPEQNLFLASLVCNVSYTGQRILTWDAPDGVTTRSNTQQAEQPPGNTLPGTLGGSAYSPYKEVDDFVLTVIKKDGVQGFIRRWNYFVGEQLLVYSILNYRWCENVGRFHKSNNIMILVDLKEEIWYQKCHDPACRAFRSSSYPLPKEICVSYLMKKDEEEEERYFMDAAGNIGLREAPGTAPHSAAPQPDTVLDDWAEGANDQAYVEALEDFEKSIEFPEAASETDQVLLEFMTNFESG